MERMMNVQKWHSMPMRIHQSYLGIGLRQLIIGFFITMLCAGLAIAQTTPSSCGPIENGYGPFDYRTQRDNLKVVEQFHFTPTVESLISGSSGAIGGDLDYTLRASPNHHRALMAMMRLGEKLKSPQPTGARYSVECWFERALRFRPDDNTARMIYATYLAKSGREQETIKQLEIATQSAGDNPFTHNNIGLIYFDIKKYESALAQAHKAYSLGFGQPTLRDRLKGVGKWKESDDLSASGQGEIQKSSPSAAEGSTSEGSPSPKKDNAAD
jgi:hypothetical protein